MRLPHSFTLLSTFTTLSSAFYIPGWSIRTYKDNDPIPLQTNKISSPLTQLPYAYSELPFVCPAKKDGFGSRFGSRHVGLNIGEVLRGDRREISDYQLFMGKDVVCAHLCDAEMDAGTAATARRLVQEGYVAEWIVDNLPGATKFVALDKKKTYYAAGFKLGYNEADKAYLNNHVTFVLRWRKYNGDNNKKVIVAFEVYTKSIAGHQGKCPESLDDQPPLELALPQVPDPSSADPERTIDDPDGKIIIPYTYSVYWKEDNSIEWANRWDLYFVNDDESVSVHWLAIINSLVIAFLLTIVVAIVMLRTLSRDIHNYTDLDPETKSQPSSSNSGNLLESADDLDDTPGWKLLHGDVFRPPPLGGLFAPLIGSGIQLLVVIISLLLLSATGILNPSYRGGFLSFSIFLFVFAGLIAGYVSTRVYKTFSGTNWKKNALLTATIFPGFVFSTVFALNIFMWVQESSSAIPFTTILALLFLWAGIQSPLVYAGASIGFRAAPWEPPTRTTQIPRQPPSPETVKWYLRPLPLTLLSGLIPFAVIFIELLYIFKSLWADKSSYYYMFGFLAIVAVIFFVTVVEVAVVATYLLLCKEEWRWWWRAFSVGAGSAVWVAIYSAWYWVAVLGVRGWRSAVVYWGWMGLGCVVWGVMWGTVGVVASWVFVARIYRAIKAD
ncbi:hypothetical protein EX30DRAFT_335292 [Ascodesmis nigricans]|uniref:Transmembrane 9 superfamily member n=1 Tax=Ascodesmis nigricans TaxID=341454 RepID=A0A4S2MRG9_9PEZI|nr:hypothetical protein EX30DRAFT_335292 [Ascodesmis nigricans]